MRHKQIPQIPAVGKLLVSRPFIEIGGIDETVILLFQHDPNLITRGLIINKAADFCLSDYFDDDDFPELDMPIYYGGNRSQKFTYCIHSLGKIIGNSGFEVFPGLFFEAVDDRLMLMVTEKLVDPNKIRFIYGYFEWLPGRVLKEIKDRYWFVGEASANTIMTYHSLDMEHELWSKILDNQGPTLSVFAHLLANFSRN